MWVGVNSRDRRNHIDGIPHRNRQKRAACGNTAVDEEANHTPIQSVSPIALALVIGIRDGPSLRQHASKRIRYGISTPTNRRIVPWIVQIRTPRKHAACHLDEQWNNVRREYISEERRQLILLNEPQLDRLSCYPLESLAHIVGGVIPWSMELCNMRLVRRGDVS